MVEELWVTLRSFVDVDGDGLTDDGQAIYDEACRRRSCEVQAASCGSRAAAGDRLRIVGNADLLNGDDWKSFRKSCWTAQAKRSPSSTTRWIGRRTCGFHPHALSQRHGGWQQELLVHGDSSRPQARRGNRDTPVVARRSRVYAQIEAFVEKTENAGNEDYLTWDLLLAPHHCSRNAVRRKDGEQWVDAGAADDSRRYAADGAVVVVSARTSEGISRMTLTLRTRTLARSTTTSSVQTVFRALATTPMDPKAILCITWDDGGRISVAESSAQRWRSVGTVPSTAAAIHPGEEIVRGGDRPYA